MSELLLSDMQFSADKDGTSTVLFRWKSEEGEKYAKACKWEGPLTVPLVISAFESLIDDLKDKFNLYRKAPA